MHCKSCPALLSALLLSASLLPALAADDEYRSGADQRSALSLTVYNGGRALIREQRRLDVPGQRRHIALMDVPQQILPQTVAIDGLAVREQNYDFDLLSPQSLLRKHVGQKVRIARRARNDGETLEWRAATLLATNGGIILRMDDGHIEVLGGDSRYHIVYDDIPEDLRERPTLSLKLEHPVHGKTRIGLTYLTGGLSWRSDYVLELDADGGQARLVNWVTIDNQSGATYRNARIQLLAGEVNQATPGRALHRAEKMLTVMADRAAPAREALGGYHLYSLSWPTDLLHNQKKQIRLFARQQIPVKRLLSDRAWLGGYSSKPVKSKPDILLRMSNRKPGLGLPLPAGVVRVYGPDSQGNTQFLGEDRIGHTAVNDELELRLGKAFDVTIERRIIKHRQISKQQYRITREIIINNGGGQTQTLALTDILPGRDWSVLASSRQWIRRSPEEIGFDLTLKPKSTLRIEYRLEMRQP